MSDLDLLKETTHELVDNILLSVAEGVRDDLQAYARSHQRSGELARNITLRPMKTKIGYTIDGGARSNFSDKSYHPIHFFIHPDGKKELTRVLRDAKDKLK